MAAVECSSSPPAAQREGVGPLGYRWLCDGRGRHRRRGLRRRGLCRRPAVQHCGSHDPTAARDVQHARLRLEQEVTLQSTLYRYVTVEVPRLGQSSTLKGGTS